MVESSKLKLSPDRVLRLFKRHVVEPQQYNLETRPSAIITPSPSKKELRPEIIVATLADHSPKQVVPNGEKEAESPELPTITPEEPTQPLEPPEETSQLSAPQINGTKASIQTDPDDFMTSAQREMYEAMAEREKRQVVKDKPLTQDEQIFADAVLCRALKYLRY